MKPRHRTGDDATVPCECSCVLCVAGYVAYTVQGQWPETELGWSQEAWRVAPVPGSSPWPSLPGLEGLLVGALAGQGGRVVGGVGHPRQGLMRSQCHSKS